METYQKSNLCYIMYDLINNFKNLMISPKIERLSDQLVVLEKNKQFDDAEIVAKTIVSFFSDSEIKIKPFRSSQFKEKTKNRFFPKPWHGDDLPCTLEITWCEAPIDFKLFWTKKVSKQIIAGITNFSPNFEDSPIHEDCNMWIDIIVPNSTDRVILVLTDKYILRTLELHGKLTATQHEILHKWTQDFDFSNKKLLHQTLWNSFSIKVINNKFYESISRTFVNLVQHLEHQWLDSHESRQFTNRLIGRVVFCRFLKKKNIISEKFDYFNIKEDNSTDYYNNVLNRLFFYTLNLPIEDRTHSVRNIWVDKETPYLNWWLFEKRWYDHKDEITFPVRFFHEFFGFLNEYNFTTDESTSTYQQVAVDPEMLGRIFENLLAEQNTETGEQARKAKGAFYTPREIVDYMCTEALKAHLSQKLTKQQVPENDIKQIIDQLFVKSDSEYALNSKGASYDTIQMKYRWNIIGILDNLTVIDPACWSGAFPMWMLQKILKCYERILPETKFDSAEAKKKIIENSLFGVDIEPTAVEISRLRAWLSIVVDEINENKIEPLPNLDFKFICANSLIWLKNWTQQMSLGEDEKLKEILKELRHKYYKARTPKTKNDIKNQYLNLLNQWLFEDSPNTKLLKSFNVFDLNKPAWFFDSDYMFGEESFDVVIGNPPYVRISWINKDFDIVIRDTYKSVFWNYDLYIPFIERSIQLLKPSWILTFITPNKFLTKKYWNRLRPILLKDIKMCRFIDTSNAKTFDSASVYPVISIFEKSIANESHEVSISIVDNNNFEEFFMNHEQNYYNVPQKVFRENKNHMIDIHIDLKSRELCDKISKECSEISSFARVLTGTPAIQKYYEWDKLIFDGNEQVIRDNVLKFINVSSLDKYSICWGKKVRAVGKVLENAYIKFDSELIWKNKREVFLQKKIVIKWNAKDLTAAYDDVWYANLSLYWLIFKDKNRQNEKNINYYLLWLLNSKVLNYRYKKKFATTNIAWWYLSFNGIYLEQIPIKFSTPAMENTIVYLVDKILSTKKEDPTADTNKLEKEIDQIAYKLYGLTNEEIDVIEDSAKK